jgi:hypothetical protein|tara:strand:- start:80 stop:283 length:204 start_codon:yes stop_codon:yes gene_type:complete
MTSHFELFCISIINPSTMERIDQGQMRAREAKVFVEKMEAQGVPVVVQGIEGDSSTFNEYLLDNLDI